MTVKEPGRAMLVAMLDQDIATATDLTKGLVRIARMMLVDAPEQPPEYAAAAISKLLMREVGHDDLATLAGIMVYLMAKGKTF